MIKVSSDFQLTPEIASKLIDEHKQNILPRLQKLEDYYLANNDILQRQMADPAKPNNRIANPYASYITNTLTGYFIGEPITYSSLDTQLLEELNLIFEYNDEADENMELARACSIFGIAYELLYADENGALRFAKLDSKTCIPIFDDTIENNLLYLIRYYSNKDIATDTTYMYVELIDSNKTVKYRTTEQSKTLEFIDEVPHYFGMVPVAIYKNNDNEMGDFEPVLSLIDAYDKLESDTLNDFEYFADAYLALTGLTADAEDVAEMKQNRVLLLDKDSDAKWLIKDEPDGTIENMKLRIDKDIHKFSNCPNLSDENFASNSSGVAIKYKMIGTENLIATKERKFKRGLQQRLELIAAINQLKVTGFDWRSISIVFNRNLPSNDTEIAQIVNALSGIVSKETLLAQIPFVEDVQNELELLKKEKKENPFYDVRLGFNGEDADEEDKEEE